MDNFINKLLKELDETENMFRNKLEVIDAPHSHYLTISAQLSMVKYIKLYILDEVAKYSNANDF